MNTSSTTGTAILRGLYNFIGTTAAGAVSNYLVLGAVVDGVSTQDKAITSILVGLIAGLGALGFRAGVEGTYDKHRQNAGAVESSDVQAGTSGEA